MKTFQSRLSYEEVEKYLREYSLTEQPYDFNGLLHLMLAAIDNLNQHHLDADLESYAGGISPKQLGFLKKLIEYSNDPIINHFQTMENLIEEKPYLTGRIVELIIDCIYLLKSNVPENELKNIDELLTPDERELFFEIAGYFASPRQNQSGKSNEENYRQICELLRQQKKLEAVKLYRKFSGTGLKTALEAIENIEKEI